MSNIKKTTATKEDGKTALVPKLRFPEFQDAAGWVLKEVGEVFQVTRGDVLSMGLVQDEKTDVMLYPVYSSQTKNNGLSGYYSDYLFEDAITWTTDGANAGDVNYRKGKFFCTNVCGVLLNSKGFANPCVAALINRVSAQYVSYVGNPKLMNGVMSKIPIPFPPIPEQQKIAECLSSVDELMAAQARKLVALKTHKKGLMQQLFPREGETQPRLRFPEFQNAGEWGVYPFEEFVAKSFYGTSSSTSPTGKFPVLRMGNMADGGLDFTNLVYIDLEPDSFESFRLEDGDILLNRTNSPALVGKISIFRLKTECITASYIVTYRLNKKLIDPLFCNFMLNTPLHQAKIKSLAKPSVSQANINPTTFKKELIVTVPSLPEQQRIADCLTSLDALIAAQTQKLDALKLHKKGLMQQLFPSSKEQDTP